MSDRRPRLPAALAIGIGLELFSVLVTLLLKVVKIDTESARIQLADQGIGIASDLILMAGVFVLARRLVGTAASGARLVGYLLIARLVMVVVWVIFECYTFVGHPSASVERFYTVTGWIYFVLAAGIGFGWILAAGGFAQRIALAVPTMILVLLGSAPYTITEPLFRLAGDGLVLRMLTRLAVATLVVVLGVIAARDAPEVPEPEAAAIGLRLSASGLWLRIIAALGIACLTLLLAGGGARDGQSVLKVVLLAGQVINIVAFVRFGLGALQTAGSDAPDLPRYPFAIGGTLSLWCASVMVVQTPWLFETLYGDAGWRTSESAQLLAIILPLVAATGMVFVVIGISGVAARRGLVTISDSAGPRGAAFVTLTLASIAIQSFILPTVETVSTLVLASLTIAVAGFIAIVQVAKLCASAADHLGMEPSLPKATARLTDQP